MGVNEIGGGGGGDTTSLEAQIAAINSKVGADATGSVVTVTALAEAQSLSGMMLFDDVTMIFDSSNATDWQDMVDAMPKCGNGRTWKISFSDGTYTLSSELTFTGFSGYSRISLYSINESNWANSASKTVVINGSISFINCNCGWIWLQGLQIASAGYYAIVFRQGGGYSQIYQCALTAGATLAETGCVLQSFSGITLMLTYVHVGGGNAGVSSILGRVGLYNITSMPANLPAYGIVSGYGATVALTNGTWPNGSISGQNPTAYYGGIAVPLAGSVLS